MISVVRDWIDDAASYLRFEGVDLTPLKVMLHFGKGRRASFYRHLSTKMSNNMPAEKAIEKYRLQQIKRKRNTLAAIIETIGARYENGHKIQVALSGFVPDAELAILASGEKAGNLNVIIDRMLEAQEILAEIMATMFMSVFPAVIYAIALYVVLIVVGRMAIPSIPAGTDLSGLTFSGQFVYAVSIISNGPLAVIPPVLTIIAASALGFSFARWTGRWRKVADRWFPYSFYRDMIGFTWILSFTSLLKAGETEEEILEFQSLWATPWLRERLSDTAALVRNGTKFGTALIETGYDFPNPDLVDDIESMAGQSDFADRINNRVDKWGKDVKRSAGRKVFFFALGFEIFMYLLIGLVISGIDDLSTATGLMTSN